MNFVELETLDLQLHQVMLFVKSIFYHVYIIQMSWRIKALGLSFPLLRSFGKFEISQKSFVSIRS